MQKNFRERRSRWWRLAVPACATAIGACAVQTTSPELRGEEQPAAGGAPNENLASAGADAVSAAGAPEMAAGGGPAGGGSPPASAGGPTSGGTAPGGGSGGSPAVGGSGSGGASPGGAGAPTASCAPECAMQATASTGIVDDLETSSATAKLAGGWFSYDDGTGSTSPAVSNEAAPESTAGAGSATTFAMHLAGTAHTGWGGGLGAWLNGCTDVSAFSKIKFRAKGSGNFRFNAITFETNGCAQGGGCAAGCSLNGAQFSLEAEWTEHEIALSALSGGNAPFSKLRLQSLSFSVLPPGTSPFDWEIWLDDVRFE